LLIHRLTGGRWGTALAPVLMPAAAMVPLLALIFLPLAFGLSAPYRWASDTSVLRPAVAHVYLNQPAFLLRSVSSRAGVNLLLVSYIVSDFVGLSVCTRSSEGNRPSLPDCSDISSFSAVVLLARSSVSP
jgi:hypothetical protein